MGRSYEIFASANKSLFRVVPPIPEAGKLRDPLSAGNPPGPRRSAAAGAGVYTGDVLTQPLPQGAQTQGTVVVAKVTTPI